MQVVIEIPDYLVDFKALGLTDDERRFIVDYVARTPDAGVEMKGTGGGLARSGSPDGVKGKAEATGSLPFMPGKTFRHFCCLSFRKVKKPISHKQKEMN